MPPTVVSRPLINRLFALLTGGAPATAPATAQEVQSPFAGTGPMAAQGCAKPQRLDPTYERPDVAPAEGVGHSREYN